MNTIVMNDLSIYMIFMEPLIGIHGKKIERKVLPYKDLGKTGAPRRVVTPLIA